MAQSTMMQRVSVCLIAGLLGVSATRAQTSTLVSPTGLEKTDGNILFLPANTPFPTPGPVGTPDGSRTQEVHPSSAFESLGSGPFTISSLAWRPDISVNAPTSAEWDLTLSLSTTKTQPNSLSTTFADNYGDAGFAQVFSGPVQFQTDGAPPGVGLPHEFDYVVEFDQPYIYDPQQGNLLVEWMTPTDLATSWIWVDADDRTGAFVFDPSAEAEEARFPGAGLFVTQFNIVPEPSSSLPSILIDDFNDGDDDGWSHLEWQQGWRDPPGLEGSSWEVNAAGEYQMMSEVPRNGHILAAVWDESDHPAFTDGFWRTTVRAETEDPTFLIATLRWPDPPNSQQHYHMILQPNEGKMQIAKGPGTDNVLAEADIEIQANEDWVMEAGAVGDELSFRAWHVGDEPPSAAQLTVTDSSYEAGTFAINGTTIGPSSRGRVSTVFDDVYFIPFPSRDLDGDGSLSVIDIDLLLQTVEAGTNDARFDLNNDDSVDADDIIALVEWPTGLSSYVGDSNLDGEFNSSDLIVVFQAGQYEDDVAMNSAWSAGDWNGDAEFDSGDLVFAFRSGGYESGPRVSTSQVPEPVGGFLFSLGAIGGFALRRRYAHKAFGSVGLLGAARLLNTSRWQVTA